MKIIKLNPVARRTVKQAVLEKFSTKYGKAVLTEQLRFLKNNPMYVIAGGTVA